MKGLLKALSRKTSSGRFIPEIDGLRFIAISAVVASHLRYFLDKNGGGPYAGHLAADPIAEALGRGQVGVQIFFAISGFILALPFAAAHLRGSRLPSLRAYFLRRLTRLEPPYLLALALFFGLRVVLQHTGARELLPHLLASAGYVHNLVYGVASTVLAVAWSLEVEVQFYVVVPLLTQIFRIQDPFLRRSVIVLIALGVAVLRGFVLATHSTYAELTLVGHLQFFLVGFLVADVYLTDWEQTPRANVLFDVLALGGFGALALGLPRAYGPSMIAFPILVFLITFGAFRGSLFRTFLRNPYVSTVGGMCYSIYLVHSPIITMVGMAMKRFVVHGSSFLVDFARLSLVEVPVILVLSTMYFVLVERPCMERDWPMRLWSRLCGRGD